MMSGSEGASVKRNAGNPQRDHPHREAPPPEPADRPADPRREHGADEIDDENRAEPAGGEIVGRGGEMKADEGERADEIEQHAEADRVGREQLAVAEMREHLPPGRQQSFRAHEFPLMRQQKCDRDRAGKGDRRRAPMKPARQPIRSASNPVTSRPLKPPRLDPDV